MKKAAIIIAIVCGLLGGPAASAGQNSPSAPAKESAERSIEYLRRAQDAFHNRYPVYDDISSAGNHFHAWAKIPDGTAPVDMNGTWTQTRHSGATSIRCSFTPQVGLPSFGGFYLQNGLLTGNDTSPQPNFGDVANAGVNLTGATALTLWVRGHSGGEQIEFFVGGVGRDADSGAALKPFPDSSPRRPSRGTVTTLSTTWQQVRIELAGMDLSYVLAGLGWVADVTRNPTGAVFYIDDIEFDLSPSRRNQRLNEPRFIKSFTTLPLQPDPFDSVQDGDIDFVLRNIAYTYDNSLALLAFLAEGSADSIRRARLIGDAFVYAMQHDRTYNDNRACGQAIDPLSVNGARLRTAYTAGDLSLPPGWVPKGRTGTVGIPGFYAEATKTFYEVEQQTLDTGNMLWALIALNALHQQTKAASYLDAACKLGNFIHALRNDIGMFPGFTGGILTPEGTPVRLMWASTEHNLDATAAFTTLHALTGTAQWQQDALHAQQFVESMWKGSTNCYVAGTTDPNTRNEIAGQLPSDLQAWSQLALPSPVPHPTALDCAKTNHWTTKDGLTGVDFNEDRDAVWLEGTGQFAVASERAGRSVDAETLRATLRFAQQTDPFGDGYGIVSASRDGLTTGFNTYAGDPFKYFRRQAVAVASWNVFGQLNMNPYYSRSLTVSVTGQGNVQGLPTGDCASTCDISLIDGSLVTLEAVPATGWALDRWTGDCAGSSVQCVVQLTAARNVVATFRLAPTMGLDKTALRFGAVTAGSTFAFQTQTQVVQLIQSRLGQVTWTASSDQAWLQVSPASGAGSKPLSISIAPAAGLPPNGSVAGAITLRFTGAAAATATIAVALRLTPLGSSAFPIGTVDTPTDNRTGVTGAIPFTGWALDDIEVTRVSICRAAVGAEVAPVDPNCGGAAEIFVGFAVFVDGMRPDVAGTFAAYPLSTRAGWGFMVLTNFLPNQGNGTYTFRMRAFDREGQAFLLGTRTMTCANASATLPFGTIDTPLQGGVASGNGYVNFGWVLTPLPKTIPVDGSTIHVLVDGVDVGTADYNHARPDIQALFPGYNNTNGAVGFRILDTTALTNGVHTISWTVTDNQGATEGIGSRFFTVSNGVSAVTVAPLSVRAASRAHLEIDDLSSEMTALAGRTGWDLEAPYQVFVPASTGVTFVRSEEVGRIELQLGAGEVSGYLRTADRLAPLPVGSHLDRTTNTFTWAPGVGFVGRYDFVFVRSIDGHAVSRRTVRVILQPKGQGE